MIKTPLKWVYIYIYNLMIIIIDNDLPIYISVSVGVYFTKHQLYGQEIPWLDHIILLNIYIYICYIVTYVDSHLHTCTYICRIIYSDTTIKTQEGKRTKTSLTTYLPLNLLQGSKRLFKVCMWEGAGDRT